MTEKEILIRALERIKTPIVCNNKKCIEIENSCYGENISITFDKNGNITNIYC